MRNLPYKFFLVLFIASFPTLALGQETPEEISLLSPEKPVIEQSESAPVLAPATPHFFHSAHKRPLRPLDVALREPVESLGADRHRFVRCELKDGSSRVGAA